MSLYLLLWYAFKTSPFTSASPETPSKHRLCICFSDMPSTHRLLHLLPWNAFKTSSFTSASLNYLCNIVFMYTSLKRLHNIVFISASLICLQTSLKLMFYLIRFLEWTKIPSRWFQLTSLYSRNAPALDSSYLRLGRLLSELLPWLYIW